MYREYPLLLVAAAPANGDLGEDSARSLCCSLSYDMGIWMASSLHEQWSLGVTPDV